MFGCDYDDDDDDENGWQKMTKIINKWKNKRNELLKEETNQWIWKMLVVKMHLVRRKRGREKIKERPISFVLLIVVVVFGTRYQVVFIYYVDILYVV